jgi:hypothetical protein
VTHGEHLGNGLHRQAVSMSLADGLVALNAQLLGFPFKPALPLRVGLGKDFQLRLGLGCFSFRSSDLMIVKPIPANRLA